VNVRQAGATVTADAAKKAFKAQGAEIKASSELAHLAARC
jgi:hypothetical protein